MIEHFLFLLLPPQFIFHEGLTALFKQWIFTFFKDKNDYELDLKELIGERYNCTDDSDSQIFTRGHHAAQLCAQSTSGVPEQGGMAVLSLHALERASDTHDDLQTMPPGYHRAAFSRMQ